jgi:hypothetical protein
VFSFVTVLLASDLRHCHQNRGGQGGPQRERTSTWGYQVLNIITDKTLRTYQSRDHLESKGKDSPHQTWVQALAEKVSFRGICAR